VRHTADHAAEANPGRASTLGGARSTVCVPMLKDDALIGTITIYRQEVRPFTDKQIALVQNFAAQAVIAIENTRLLKELRQSLDQQTATAEVLRVISALPGELVPVFEAMLEKSIRIAEAGFGQMFLCDRGAFRVVSNFRVPSALAEWDEQRGAFQPMAGGTLEGIVRTKQVIQVADLSSRYAAVPAARLGGARSYIAVPMLKENELIGVIVIYRQEVRPFTEKQIALVETFADQAVIAIENARLLNELRHRTDDLTESLEQQTATSEMLGVISSSPGELEPVFQAMLANATRICEASYGSLHLYDEFGFHPVARLGVPAALAEYQRQNPSIRPKPGSNLDLLMRSKEVVHIADDASSLSPGAPARFAGARSTLTVPMLKEKDLIGAFSIYRQEVRPFTDKQIELVQNFAAQAVIAIENARLLSELRQRTYDLSKSLEDLRTAQDRLVQTQKLASLGQLTAGIAHEIKNPLNFVNNFSGVSVELIDELQAAVKRGSFDDGTQAEVAELTETLRDNLDKIAQHGKRADSIVKNMLLHSREGLGEHRPIDINALVEESLNLAYHGARAEKQGFTITLERAFDPAAGEVDIFPRTSPGRC
jgi:two-component system, NtrC family, sensor kinase